MMQTRRSPTWCKTVEHVDDSVEYVVTQLLDLPFHHTFGCLPAGQYKTYLRRQYNDASVKGTIDVPRHIRENIPFVGNVAYNTREMSYDNNMTQLVHHTIKYVEHHSYDANILSQNDDIREAVRTFKEATPSYSYHDQQTIIKWNLRPIAHSYFKEYTNLQQQWTCLIFANGCLNQRKFSAKTWVKFYTIFPL